MPYKTPPCDESCPHWPGLGGACIALSDGCCPLHISDTEHLHRMATDPDYTRPWVVEVRTGRFVGRAGRGWREPGAVNGKEECSGCSLFVPSDLSGPSCRHPDGYQASERGGRCFNRVTGGAR
jgi:hypothetical protein